jgi:hypothetical protein
MCQQPKHLIHCITFPVPSLCNGCWHHPKQNRNSLLFRCSARWSPWKWENWALLVLIVALNYNINIRLPYFRLSLRCNWNLCSPRLLRNMSWLSTFQDCVSAHHTKVNMFKVISLHCDTLSQNVGNLPTCAAQRPRTAKILMILIQIIIFCEFYFCDIYSVLSFMFLSPPPCTRNCNNWCSRFHYNI